VDTPRYRRRTDAARYVRETWGMLCSQAWLAKLAVVGGGPIFRKAGRFPIYLDSDLDICPKPELAPPAAQHLSRLNGPTAAAVQKLRLRISGRWKPAVPTSYRTGWHFRQLSIGYSTGTYSH
jgi:hypothetical protein